MFEHLEVLEDNREVVQQHPQLPTPPDVSVFRVEHRVFTARVSARVQLPGR